MTTAGGLFAFGKPMNRNKGSLPLRKDDSITPAKLCRRLGVGKLEDIYNLSFLLRAGSLKLYAVFVAQADENGNIIRKVHELMRDAGMNNLATFYKHERWLTDLGLIEKRPKPGPHEGSSYRVYALESLPIKPLILEEFERYLSSSVEMFDN